MSLTPSSSSQGFDKTLIPSSFNQGFGKTLTRSPSIGDFHKMRGDLSNILKDEPIDPSEDLERRNSELQQANDRLYHETIARQDTIADQERQISQLRETIQRLYQDKLALHTSNESYRVYLEVIKTNSAIMKELAGMKLEPPVEPQAVPLRHSPRGTDLSPRLSPRLQDLLGEAKGSLESPTTPTGSPRKAAGLSPRVHALKSQELHHSSPT